jgi:hypothetical protein
MANEVFACSTPAMDSTHTPHLANLAFRCFLSLFALNLSLFSTPTPSLESGFDNPPHGSRPLTWWHWINGNVTKEGIRADLEDMKRVGLAGVQLVDVEIHLPPGPVRYGSVEWHDMVQYAIKTAAELDLDFTVTNCPGWATGGGPWISVDQSMKQLVWSEMAVTGSSVPPLMIPRPTDMLGYYRDIAALAIPEGGDAIGPPHIVIPEAPDCPSASLMDSNSRTIFSFPKNLPNPSVVLAYEEPTERRLLEITFPARRSDTAFSGLIEFSVDGVAYELLRPFQFLAPLQSSEVMTIPFPPTTARFFRISFAVAAKAAERGVEIADLRLSNRQRVENVISKSMTKSIAPGLPWAGVFSMEGGVRADQVIDLTSRMAPDGSIDWEIPPGCWTILRLGYTTTGAKNHPAQPEGTGLEADKMDAAVVRFHAEKALGKIIADAGSLRGKTLSSILIDSWEAGSQNWTKSFPSEFLKRRGYEMSPYFPALAGFVINSQAESEAFLADFRLTASELVAENFYGGLLNYAHENEMKLFVEPYTSPSYNLFQVGEFADVIMGEFWIDGFKNNKTPLKKVASMVHTQGRTLLGAEAFSARVNVGRWLQTPGNLKTEGDQAFAHGLNQAIFHTYVHQPDSTLQPGFTLGRYGTHFGRTNTWWPWVTGWTEYLARCQFLLQQGLFVADFLVLVTHEVNGMMDWTPPTFPQGYQYDYIASNRLQGTVAKEGKIILPNGAEYQAVFLPPAWTADLALLDHLQALVDQGATVAGPKPIAPAGLRDRQQQMAQWQARVSRLWTADAGKKRVLPLSSSAAIIAGLKLRPDFAWKSAKGRLDLPYTHRRVGDTDLYFVCNPSSDTVRFTGLFRIASRIPELWDAVSGDRQLAPVYRPMEQSTEVDLSLAPGGSMFVVFRKPLPPVWIASMQAAEGKLLYPPLDFKRQGPSYLFNQSGTFTATTSTGAKQSLTIPELVTIPLSGPWQVDFTPSYGPSFQRSFEQLSSWSDSAESEIKYFSGPATYRCDFAVPSKQSSARWTLDLGEVCDLAEVRLNGKLAGILWAGLFQTDVTDLLQPGINKLEITVANRWVNRMVGDELLPPDADYQTGGWASTIGRLERFPEWHTDPAKRQHRRRKSFTTWRFYDAHYPLLRSGLLGPVQLVGCLAGLP